MYMVYGFQLTELQGQTLGQSANDVRNRKHLANTCAKEVSPKELSKYLSMEFQEKYEYG